MTTTGALCVRDSDRYLQVKECVNQYPVNGDVTDRGEMRKMSPLALRNYICRAETASSPPYAS